MENKMKSNDYYQVFKDGFFTCIYCGFDGRTFDNWMQLTLDHVNPKQCEGEDSYDNLRVACHSCNSITSKMTFNKDETTREIIGKKRKQVKMRRVEYYNRWIKTVGPYYLEKKLVDIK